MLKSKLVNQKISCKAIKIWTQKHKTNRTKSPVSFNEHHNTLIKQEFSLVFLFPKNDAGQ